MKKLGFAIIAVLPMLAMTACSGGTAPTSAASGSAAASAGGAAVTIVGPWRSAEADTFEKVLDGFRSKTGITVTYSGVPDVVAALTPRISAGSPPDIAILPTGNGFLDYSAQGVLKPLTFMQSEMTNDFDKALINQFSKDGKAYAIPTRADMGNVLLYNPSVLKTPPATWADLVTLCGTAKATYSKSCTAGMGKDVWPLYLIFQAAYISTNGADKYNDLLAGKIPFDDASVAEAVKRVTMFYGNDWVAGGTSGAMGSGLVDGLSRVFGTSSDALVANAGSWGVGLVEGAVDKAAVEGKTIDYVLFPYDEAGKEAVVVNTDAAVLLTDNASVQSLAKYLASAEGQGLFVKSGYTVANKTVDVSSLTGAKAKTANFLKTGKLGASLISNDLKNQLQTLLGKAINDPTKIDALLKAFAPVAAAGIGG